MKKLLTIAVASIAVAAVADVATYSPSIGVTSIPLSQKNNVIPVQFNSLATSGNVTAGELVCTNNIPLNSHLYVYDDGYTAWKLEATGWKALDVVSSSDDGDGVSYSGTATGKTLSTGSAIWLSFPNTPSPSSAINVSFYGKVATSTNSTIVAGKCNLLANPTSGPVDIIAKISSGMAQGDQIRVVGSQDVIFWFGDGWKKQVSEKPVAFADVSTLSVSACGGFWYYSKGSSNITINW